MTQMNFYETETGLTDIENRRVVAKLEGHGEGCVGILGLVYANYYI